MDKNGKAKYSNVETRSLALTSLRRTDKECKDSSTAVNATEKTMNDAQAEYDRLSDEFKARRYVARLVSAELLLIAECEESQNRTETTNGNVGKEDEF